MNDPNKYDGLAETAEKDMNSEEKEVNLTQEFSAKVWAKEFSRMYPMILKDGEGALPTEELMLGWFANAIMAGYDNARRSAPVGQLADIPLKILKDLAETGCDKYWADCDAKKKSKYSLPDYCAIEIHKHLSKFAQPVGQPLSEEAVEALAEYAHTAWSGWIKYMFGKSKCRKDGTWVIPVWGAERWLKQAETPYNALSEEEKESDRTEARRMIEIAAKFSCPVMRVEEIKKQLDELDGIWGVIGVNRQKAEAIAEAQRRKSG